MGNHFHQLNEEPLRFEAPIEEAKWDANWQTYFGTIYLSQKVLSDCGQEITINEEQFLLSIPKEIYEEYEKRSADFEYDYYGRMLVTLDADLYMEFIRSNAYTLGHQLKVLQIAPLKQNLPPFIRPVAEEADFEIMDSIIAISEATTNYDKDINFEIPDDFNQL